MGCLKTICQIWIMKVNVLFLLIGLTISILGFLIRFNKDMIDNYIEDAKKKVVEMASSGGVTVNLDKLDFAEILNEVAMGFIFVGVFLVVICFLGCCGSCCSITTCLGLYVGICGFLVLVEIILAGVIYIRPETVQDPTKTSLKDGITSDFQGVAGTNLNSMAWNVIMAKFECCGVDSYQDFASATWTLKTTDGLVAPLSCCTSNPTASKACAKFATLSVHGEGCYSKIWNKTIGNSLLIGITCGIIGGFQLSLILAGGYLLRTAMKKDEKKKKKNRVGASA